MVHYANLHAVFDEQRKQAMKNETAGPKVKLCLGLKFFYYY